MDKNGHPVLIKTMNGLEFINLFSLDKRVHSFVASFLTGELDTVMLAMEFLSRLS